VGKKKFSYRVYVIVMWNGLPDQIVGVRSVNVFKREVNNQSISGL